MAGRFLRIVILVGALIALGGLGYWVWLEGRVERQREEQRELSIKVPARRMVDPDTQEVVIRLDPESQDRLGLVAERPEHTRRQIRTKLLGFSVVVPHRSGEIRSPWTGVLETPAEGSMPIVGDQIRKGQTLAVLLVQWSPSDRIQLENMLRDVRGTIGETEAEIEVTRNAVERLRKVSDGGVAGKQLLEAEGQLAKFQARLTAAQAREKALEEALAKKESQVRFQFIAPQDGQLTELHHRPGEVVSAGDLVATIYDSRDLWVSVLALPGQLPPGQVPKEAEIRFLGFESQALRAQLVRIKPQIERGQQGLEFVYATSNPAGEIPAGLQAEVWVTIGQPIDVAAVPRSAVLQVNEQRLVYVQRNSEEFAKQIVEVEDEDEERAYLRPTLARDARVVRQGAQSLLSEEYKEAIQLVEEGSKSGQSKPEQP